MAKKKQRAKYTSKGERKADTWTSKAVRRDVSEMDTHLNKMNAFLKGKRVFFTVPNGNSEETAKPFVRVEGKLLYGDYRTYGKIFKNEKEKANA